MTVFVNEALREFKPISSTPWTDARVFEPGDDGHSGFVEADFARRLEALCRQQQNFIELYLAKADAMHKQACQEGVSQMLHTNGDAQQARTLCAAYNALQKELDPRNTPSST